MRHDLRPVSSHTSVVDVLVIFICTLVTSSNEHSCLTELYMKGTSCFITSSSDRLA